jgi:hypothetical protein
MISDKAYIAYIVLIPKLKNEMVKVVVLPM